MKALTGCFSLSILVIFAIQQKAKFVGLGRNGGLGHNKCVTSGLLTALCSWIIRGGDCGVLYLMSGYEPEFAMYKAQTLLMLSF